MDLKMPPLYILLVVVGIHYVPVHALICYSCAETKENRPCQTALEDMVTQAQCVSNPNNTAEDCGFRKKYTIKCPQEMKYCVIEKIESRGTVESYMRSCSDGKTWSIKGLGRLNNVQPDNQTWCDYKETGYQVCVTLCQNDLCNGPRYTDGSNIAKSSYFTVLVMILLLLYTKDSI